MAPLLFPSLPPLIHMSCEPEVFRQGHFLVNLGEVHPVLVEELCKRMRTPTLLVDWHFVGGRCCMLYIGTHAEAVAKFAEHAEWYSKVDHLYKKNKYPEFYQDPSFCNYKIWSASDCNPANVIDIGQALHRP